MAAKAVAGAGIVGSAAEAAPMAAAACAMMSAAVGAAAQPPQAARRDLLRGLLQPSFTAGTDRLRLVERDACLGELPLLLSLLPLPAATSDLDRAA